MRAPSKRNDFVQTNSRAIPPTTAAPRPRQQAPEIQAYGWYAPMPLALPEAVRRESGAHLNQLHLLFDRHADQQDELVDRLAERIMTLGGIAVAMAADVAEITLIPRAPKGREDVPTQLSRLLHAHEVVLEEARAMARAADERGDLGTNDLLVSEVVRTNEAQVWFVAMHLVAGPNDAAADAGKRPG